MFCVMWLIEFALHVKYIIVILLLCIKKDIKSVLICKTGLEGICLLTKNIKKV